MTRTQVAIVGAGPAGLTLAQLLHNEGIDSVILENRSREYVEARIRAGVVEQGIVDLLTEAGVGERMHRDGLVHHGIELQFAGERHRLPLSELTGGRSIMIYGQTEIVKDLIAARLETGRPLLFEVDDVSIDPERPLVRYTHEGEPARARVRRDRRLRRLPRRVPAEHPRRRALDLRPRLPVRLARDPGRRRAVERRADLRPSRARVRAADPAHAGVEPPLRAVRPGRGHRPLARRADLGGAAAAPRLRRLDARRGADPREGRDADAELRRRADAVWPPLPRRRRGAHRPADRRQGPQSRAPRRERARRRARVLVRDGLDRRPRRLHRGVPAPRLARRALLVVDDLDAASLAHRRPVRRAAPALPAALPDDVEGRGDRPRRELRRHRARLPASRSGAGEPRARARAWRRGCGTCASARA